MTARNWYSVLSLPVTATTEQITEAVDRMSRQAAALANTAPERSQQLREQVRGIRADLLSGDERRRAYDATPVVEGAAPSPPRNATAPLAGQAPASSPRSAAGAPRPSGGFGAKLRQFLQTGWACPSCGEGALPSDKFCPRCGTAIPAPTLTGPDSPAAPLPPRAACVNCGQPLTASARFCTGCGTPRA